MNRKKSDSSSASDVSTSGRSDSNKGKAIASGAAKVFNRIILKPRPSTTKSPTEENSTRFQIVHTPDRLPIDMPLPEIPTTNEEFYAAISRINAQGHSYGENGSVERRGVTASAREGTQQSPHSLCVVPRSAVTSPGSTTILLGPRGNGPLEKPRKELNTPEPTLSATNSGKARPVYARRVASDGIPPRPLSERPLIYSSMRARPSLQMQHGSVSTPNAQSVLPVRSNNASSKRHGHDRANSGENNGRRRPRRPPSVDSTGSSSVKSTDSDDETYRHQVSSARNIREAQQKTQDSGIDAALAQNMTRCYFCQEDCQSGDNLCSKCQTRFQPQDEVFDYSESEYEDDIEPEDSPLFPPETEQPRGTSSRSSKRRNTRRPRPREKSRGWSEFSSVSQLQQLASRSASTSPTSHVAMELKVVPPQDIKIRTVSSPTKANAGDGRSALHHIQQAMKPGVPISPGGQDRDAIRLGKVRSGEITRVDYPDIIKAKPPTPNKKSSQRSPQEHQHQSRDSFKHWLKYYNDDDKSSERDSGSAWSDCADLPTNGQSIAVPATPGTYDRVTSIYDMYASFDDT